MDGKKKALVFGIVAPPEALIEDAKADEDEGDGEVLVGALPHLPRYKEEHSLWKLFQTGLKPPIPGRLR